MLKRTGKGKYFLKVDTTQSVLRVWLYNFDINGNACKFEHLEALDEAVGPVIQDGGTVKLMGLASTTGSVAVDQRLSVERVRSVESYLRTSYGDKFIISKEVAFGKQMALAFKDKGLKGGTADKTEDEIWRGVVLNAWNRGGNKSAPMPPPLPMDTPFTNSTWADSVGQGLDKVSIGLGIVDLAADLGAIGTIAEWTTPLGLAVSVIQAIVAMPLLWASTDAVANFNGQVQGAADAYLDMARQFSDPALTTTPLSQWPAVKTVSPHVLSGDAPTASAQAWRAGQTKGGIEAMKKVLELEQNPKPITLSDGRHIRLSGRLWLYGAWKAFGEDTGIKIVIEPTNKELAKQGKRRWPTF